MMIFTIYFFFWIFYSLNGIQTNLLTLTDNQIEIWLNAVYQINTINQNSPIQIIHVGDTINIPLYKNHDEILNENRHLFKQNIHKQIDCYLYKNQIDSSQISNIYDICHGTLLSQEVLQNIAGIYVYTGNKTSYGLGLILIELSKSFQWFNNTKSYLFNKSTIIKNGTELYLGFQSNIYYNSNSDLIYLNNKINNIIQQANITINNDKENNLEIFFYMENLLCQRHEQIVNDDLRLLIIICTIKVTFKCPLQIGSSCWIENKQLSNIQFNIDSNIFINTNTITVRIDV